MAQVWMVAQILIDIPDDLHKELDSTDNGSAYRNLEAILKTKLQAEQAEIQDIWDPV